MSSYGGQQEETFWHQCALVGILVVGACARFYSLDQISFTAYELNNIAACEASSWLEMIRAYVDYSGLPPLYPTLLCGVTHTFDAADFFIRSLSVLAGLGIIYMIYITGRDFLSPAAGLLAATLLACDPQMILSNREASLISLLGLLYFVHSYLFCRLLFTPSNQNRPFQISFAGATSHFLWQWQPRFPGDGRIVVGFWITGALIFYTSSMSLILFLIELLASIYIVVHMQTLKDSSPNQNNRSLLFALWIPLLIITAPWWNTLSGYLPWIAHGYLFAIHTPDQMWQKVRPLSEFETRLFYLLTLLCIATSIYFFIVKMHYRKLHFSNNTFVIYVLFQFLIATLAALTINSDYSSYLYYTWVVILLFMAPVALVISKIPQTSIRYCVLAALIIGMMSLQITYNANHKLYDRIRGSDFRLAAKIIHDDQHFMNSHNMVYSSNNLFKHYLDAYNINTSNVVLLDKDNPANVTNLVFKITEFYYLEYQPGVSILRDDGTTFKQLSTQYKNLCVTKLQPRVLIAKFSSDTAAIADPNLDCRAFLTGTVSLK